MPTPRKTSSGRPRSMRILKASNVSASSKINEAIMARVISRILRGVLPGNEIAANTASNAVTSVSKAPSQVGETML